MGWKPDTLATEEMVTMASCLVDAIEESAPRQRPSLKLHRDGHRLAVHGGFSVDFSTDRKPELKYEVTGISEPIVSEYTGVISSRYGTGSNN